MSTLTTYQRHYEMEQLRQLKRFNPTDERVSQTAWEQWEQVWKEREARLAWEVQHGGRYVPYPTPEPQNAAQSGAEDNLGDLNEQPF